MGSTARQALDDNLKDVERLLELHTQEGGTARGRRSGLEVLNKSAIVLITAFWEAYCEDIAGEALEHLVNSVPTAGKLPKDIRKIVAGELKADKNELAIWDLSDNGWRTVLRARLQRLTEHRNRKLNTPKSEQIEDLFRTALGIEHVSNSWHWSRKMTVERAKKKLDKYVALRGEIAHRGHPDTSVEKYRVVDYYEFIKRLAAKTGGEVNRHVKDVTGSGLW